MDDDFDETPKALTNGQAASYAEFNKFQSKFYTSIDDLNACTRFEFNNHSFALLSNIGKKFPHLAHLFFEMRCPLFEATKCPPLIKALQRRFINQMTPAQYKRVPEFVYYKTPAKSTKTDKKAKDLKTVKTADGEIFSEYIVAEICSLMFYDSKTYESLKFTGNVQKLGKQLISVQIQKESVKSKTKRGKK